MQRGGSPWQHQQHRQQAVLGVAAWPFLVHYNLVGAPTRLACVVCIGSTAIALMLHSLHLLSSNLPHAGSASRALRHVYVCVVLSQLVGAACRSGARHCESLTSPCTCPGRVLGTPRAVALWLCGCCAGNACGPKQSEHMASTCMCAAYVLPCASVPCGAGVTPAARGTLLCIA